MKKRNLLNKMLALAMSLCMIFTMMPMAAHATETQETYTVYLNSSGGSGTLSGDGSYAVGSTVTITATPTDGSCFYMWGGGDGATLTDYTTETTTFTMPANDVTITANFRTHSESWGYTEDEHYKTCLFCGEVAGTRASHSYTDDTDTECECGWTREVHTHDYSDATCTTPATCSCNATQGGVDKNNHVGGTEVRNAKDATETEDGYTGDTYCLGCGDKLSDGETIPATGSGDDDDDTHTHNYTAVVTAPTCKEQGYTTYTCSCNDSYVSDYVDALDHDWGDYVSIGNGRHTRVCRNDSSHEQTTTCGGTATCHELAFCPDCKTTYGEYDQDNHSGGTEVRNAKKATETENGYTGDTYCLGCNVLISEGSIIYATGSGDDDDTHTHNYSYYKFDGTNHWKMCHCGQGQAGSVKPHSLITTGASTGHFEECTVCDYFSDVEAHVYSDDSDAYCNECGYRRHVHDYSTAATCSSPAKCGCGATTGSKDPSNHVGGTEIRNAVEATWETEGYTGDTYCKGCGAKLESGKGIPMKGYVIVKIDDDVVVEDVTFTPGEGLVLPEDAVLVVDPHTPSEENIYFLLPPNTDMEYVSVASDDIALVTPFMLNGVTFYQYDVVVFGGEEFVVVGNTDDGLHLVSFSDGNSYFFDGEYLRLVDVAPRIDIEKRDNQKLNINGVTYDVVAALDGQASLDRLILYHNGKPAGQYHLTTGKATFNEGFDPETLKAQQNVNDIGTVTTGENPIDGLESGKTYNVSVIGSQDISVPGYDEAVLNSIKAETEEEKAAKKEVERLKADMEAKRAALDQLDTNDPNHMEAWAAWDEAETAYKEALAELAALANLQSATVTQKFQIPDALVGRNNVKFVAVHNTNPHATALAAAKYKMEETMIDYWEYHGDSDEERQRLYEAANRAAMEWSIVQEHYNAWEKEHATDAETGNELGAVTIAEDGKTLTATYTVNSFSPFTVYAFVEADESEIKTLSATIVDGSDDTTEAPDTDEPVESPQTSDNTVWYILIAVVAGAIAVASVVYGKRRKSKAN